MQSTGASLALLIALAWTPAAALEPPLDDAAIEREHVRAEVESIIAELYHPPERDRDDTARAFYEISDRLLAIGPSAVPFLAAELDRPTAQSFNIAAYVLGRLGTPDAAEALERAMKRADTDGGKFGAARKEWAAYGLALAGGQQVVALLLDSGLWVGDFNLMDGVSVLELASSLTAPRSVPLLVDRLNRFRDDEPNQPKLIWVLRALRRIADPSTADAIRSFVDHERWHLRKESLLALSALGDPKLADVMLGGLSDPQQDVRIAAARALVHLQPTRKIRRVLAQLEIEPDSAIRESLYNVLADTGDDVVLEALRSHWGRDDYFDRLSIVRAVERLGSAKGVGLLRTAVADRDAGVALAAINALRRFGGEDSREALLTALDDPRWPVVQATIDALVERSEPRAAPLLAEKLVGDVLARPVTDAAGSARVRVLANALVGLRYTGALDELRRATADQREGPAFPGVVTELEGVVRLLGEVRERGGDVARWLELLHSDDEPLRHLAMDRLAELGGNESHAALVELARHAGPEEQLLVLQALSRHPSATAADLAEYVLTAPEQDGWKWRYDRSMAAWLARRIGGRDMVELLRRSVERRQGLDADVLTYFAVLAGKDALPALRAYRLTRFRFHEFDRGLEQRRIDRIVRTLERGRSLHALDLPPDEIALLPWRQ